MPNRSALPQPHPIKAVLAERRMTNAAVASRVGCNPSTLGRVLNGYISPWPALRARRAEYLGRPEPDLFRAHEEVVR